MKSKINSVLCSIGCLIAIDSIAQEEKSISVPDSFGLMNAGIISNPNKEIELSYLRGKDKNVNFTKCTLFAYLELKSINYI